MERTQTRSISRRSFIGGMTGAGALAALGLAGCAPKTAGSAEADKLSEAGAQGVADNSVVAVDDGSAAITVDWLGAPPEIAEGDITVQAEQVMKNVGEILKAANCGYEDVVKTTCFLAEMADFGAFNSVYEKYFTGKPARSCVAVKTLPKNVLCEVEVIAVQKA